MTDVFCTIDGASDPQPSNRITRTPTRESVLARQTRPNRSRYGSLHESFADVKRIDSLGQEIEDDNSPLIHNKGSQDSLVEGLRPRRVSTASYKTACSRSSSCCSSCDGSHEPENGTVAFWRRMWQILSGWIASWWAACVRKDVDDSETSDDSSSRRAVKKQN